MSLAAFHTLANQVLDACVRHQFRLSTAESCTGGMIAAVLTEIAGSSRVVDRGFVTYTNEAKHDMLTVPVHLFSSVGAVSEQVARAMAEGALARSDSQITVSVTGIAGPGGGSDDKPVGLVHMAVAMTAAETLHERHVFSGDRTAVRSQTVESALRLILKGLNEV